MRYSVVIITKDNRRLLRECLESLFADDLNGSEVLVVEGGDNSAPLPFPVKHIRVGPEGTGYGRQRNAGLRAASGEAVVFVDDDVTVPPGWFAKLTGAYEASGAKGAMGAVFPRAPGLVGFSEGIMGHPGGGFRLHAQAAGRALPLPQAATCNTVMDKKAVAEAGWFSETTVYGSEDSELSSRMGALSGRDPFVYAPEAWVWHRPRNSFARIIPWYLRRGRADADLLGSVPGHLSYFLRSSLALKLASASILSAFYGPALPLFLAAWVLLQWKRCLFARAYFGLYRFSALRGAAALAVFPFVKFTADIFFDLGRALRLCRS